MANIEGKKDFKKAKAKGIEKAHKRICMTKERWN